MVVISAGDAVLLVLLLVCVPLQMWLQHHTAHSSTPESRDGQVMALVREFCKTIQRYLSPHFWSTVLLYSTTAMHKDKEVLEYSRLSYTQLSDAPDEEGECPAVEVFRLSHPEGYFASSVHQRRYRTGLIYYRVGQVVRHSEYGIKAVIIGWDETCRAPQEFIDEAYSKELAVEVCEKANYAVLLDINDYHSTAVQYFAQQHIELLSNQKVSHPHKERYFSHFDGSRYLPAPWLAAMYPED
ncbi:Hemimethylated DNA-binding domain [Trinorchestia longiramus]|nr:Hemimethylated DNA-binding domain [Trinorchestia longiramus]